MSCAGDGETKLPAKTERRPADVERDPASFRDPSGIVYRREGRLYRQIHAEYAEHWELLHSTGLYGRLVERGWLVDHADAPLDRALDERAWKVVEPAAVSFVSYPYEWTFGQLRDAALLTLDVQTMAMEADMTLKDASAYNVLFEGARPVLIDGLSFERLDEGQPWVAYRQFCQHFLAPLALMSQRDVRLGLLLRDFVDGIPLDLAARMLPLSSRARLGLGMHLHLHARVQRRAAVARSPGAEAVRQPAQISKPRLVNLIASLRSTVAGLRWKPAGTAWSDYGETTSYSAAAAASKRALCERFLSTSSGDRVWDLGANTGTFSQLAAASGRSVVAIDADPAAAELHYRTLRRVGISGVLPLVMDLTNPSPALGWSHRERRSLVDRADADILLALALVHHLAIGNNVPFAELSSLLVRLGRQLIIEFVPKSDLRVAAMLSSRRDVFPDYSLEGFKDGLGRDWQLIDEERIDDSERSLLRFVARDP